MKKSVALLAVLASASSAYALPMPDNRPTRTICLKLHQTERGVYGSCDDSRNNVSENRTLLGNGCAEGQAAIQTTGQNVIQACMPAGAVQL
jgi:hypothetical protein